LLALPHLIERRTTNNENENENENGCVSVHGGLHVKEIVKIAECYLSAEFKSMTPTNNDPCLVSQHSNPNSNLSKLLARS
jgi:hypothetical protein